MNILKTFLKPFVWFFGRIWDGLTSNTGRFIIKRILISIVILFFVGLIVYTLMRSLPTSYIESIARERSAKQGAKPYTEMLAELRTLYSFDKTIIEGYFVWLGNALRGQFGSSWFFNIDVVEKFKSVIWYSVALGGVSLVLYTLISIPLGIISAYRQYSWSDYTITVIALIGISLPTFFFATILKVIFSLNLGWLDLYGIVSRNYMQLSPVGKIIDMAKHLIMPTLTIVIISIGSLMRYTRTNMLEVLGSDYIRTARAKGVSERKVVYYHAFRNTLIPLVTIVGGSLPGLFSGALITETLFMIPGIGWTSYQAMVGGDIPFSMFYLTFIAAMTLLGNLISDILYAVVDPRVRIG